MALHDMRHNSQYLAIYSVRSGLKKNREFFEVIRARDSVSILTCGRHFRVLLQLKEQLFHDRARPGIRAWSSRQQWDRSVAPSPSGFGVLVYWILGSEAYSWRAC